MAVQKARSMRTEHINDARLIVAVLHPMVVALKTIQGMLEDEELSAGAQRRLKGLQDLSERALVNLNTLVESLQVSEVLDGLTDEQRELLLRRLGASDDDDDE